MLHNTYQGYTILGLLVFYLVLFKYDFYYLLEAILESRIGVRGLNPVLQSGSSECYPLTFLVVCNVKIDKSLM